MKSRWQVKDVPAPAIINNRPEKTPEPPASPEPLAVSPPPSEPFEAPEHKGKRPGRKRVRGPRFVVRSVSFPAELEARLRRFMHAEKVNVSAWISTLADTDLKARGYF